MKNASTAQSTTEQSFRYEVYVETEKYGLDFKSKFSTNSYLLAIRKAKSLSKKSHSRKPKRFKHSDYDFCSSVFDNVQKRVIADFADGLPNYIENPIKPLDPQYYYIETSGFLLTSIKLADYYTELTGPTDRLVDIVSNYVSKYINTDILGTLANAIKNTTFYEEALENVRLWKEMYAEYITIPTMKAAYEIAKIYHKKSAINIIYVNSLTT